MILLTGGYVSCSGNTCVKAVVGPVEFAGQKAAQARQCAWTALLKLRIDAWDGIVR